MSGEKPAPKSYTGWYWDKRDRTQWILRDDRGNQVGNYWLKPHEWAGEYRHKYKDAIGGWGEPAEPPIPTGNEEKDNFGVVMEKISDKETPSYWLAGKSASRLDIVAALTKGDVPDDSLALRLTAICAADERKKVEADWATHPALAEFKNKIVFKSYAHDHWAVKDMGFSNTGKPTIYLQAASGKVLHRQDDYEGGAEALATAIRKSDPNYKPVNDKDKRKSDPLKDVPWGPLAPIGAALAGFLMVPKKKD